jgi:dTDP-4-amino-4,6-dideoxy-D-galactose acyltransferase
MSLTNDIPVLLDKRLKFYSPYNFLRSLDPQKDTALISDKISGWLDGSNENLLTFRTEINSQEFIFLYQFLPWDSNYFSITTFKLFTVLYPEVHFNDLILAIQHFKTELLNRKANYCIIDIPAEDILLAQALTTSGFRLTETRLTYYHDQVKSFNYDRFKVRAAVQTDIPTLREVAKEARNDYDRYHADVVFTQEQADNYLSTYAEACVNGLSETVLVPAEDNLPVDAFLAISSNKTDNEFLNAKIARVLLTAVGPACKGWHVKLVAETIQYARENNCEYVLMTTQATNHAVFRTSEKLGFKLGNTTHILAINL